MIRRIFWIFLLFTVLMWLSGLGSFIYCIRLPAPSDIAMDIPAADAIGHGRTDDAAKHFPENTGIVVLTGNNARLRGAVDIFRAYPDLPMLITGVAADVTLKDILPVADPEHALTPHQWTQFARNTTLGYTARDTLGNARETAHWARTRGYTRLLVLTSNYHMPRSLYVLGNALPEVSLIAVPIFDFYTGKPGTRWYNPHVLRVLIKEYNKYLLSWIYV